jgi:hypothetical protein
MSTNIKSLIAAQDFGETFYMIDSDYRTAAQGWTQSDGTGPLDLYAARNPGRVFYTPGGTPTPSGGTDAAAMQAANDNLVDFRGDILYFTPGTYTPATALVLDVPDARWMGSRRRRGQSASIVAGVAAAFGPTAAADSMEFAHLRFVPLTAGILFARATAGCDNWWLHDFTFDARGIAASTSTIFMKDTGACLNTIIEDFLYLSNTAGGPFFQLAAASITGAVQNWLHIHTANTIVTSMFETISGGAGASGFVIGPGHAQLGAGGLITQFGAMIDMTSAATNATIRNCTSSVGANVAATGWEAGTGIAAEGDIVNSWIATIGGGAGRAALIGGA